MNLKTLCETNAPSGKTEPLINLIDTIIENSKVKLERRIDKMGNLILTKKGSLPSVTLNAALDESSLFITHIDEKGLVHFENLGFDDMALAGKQVVVGEKEISGVIGYPAIHLHTKLGIREKAIKAGDLSIDVGARKKEELSLSLGDFALFNTSFTELGRFYSAKALDTRLPLAIALEILTQGKIKNEINLVCTSVSKSYPWGASSIAHQVKSDYSIVLQSANVADFPCEVSIANSPFQPISNLKLEGGALLNVMDNSYISDTQLFSHFIQIAEKEKIVFQVNEVVNSKSEAGSYQTTGNGQKVISLGLPIRYMGSPCQVASEKDMQLLKLLLEKAISKLPKRGTL